MVDRAGDVGAQGPRVAREVRVNQFHRDGSPQVGVFRFENGRHTSLPEHCLDCHIDLEPVPDNHAETDGDVVLVAGGRKSIVGQRRVEAEICA